MQGVDKIQTYFNVNADGTVNSYLNNASSKLCENIAVTPCRLTVSTRWMQAASLTSRPSYPQGKKPFGSLSLGGNEASVNAVSDRKFYALPRNGTLTMDPVFRDYI